MTSLPTWHGDFVLLNSAKWCQAVRNSEPTAYWLFFGDDSKELLLIFKVVWPCVLNCHWYLVSSYRLEDGWACLYLGCALHLDGPPKSRSWKSVFGIVNLEFSKFVWCFEIVCSFLDPTRINHSHVWLIRTIRLYNVCPYFNEISLNAVCKELGRIANYQSAYYDHAIWLMAVTQSQ